MNCRTDRSLCIQEGETADSYPAIHEHHLMSSEGARQLLWAVLGDTSNDSIISFFKRMKTFWSIWMIPMFMPSSSIGVIQIIENNSLPLLLSVAVQFAGRGHALKIQNCSSKQRMNSHGKVHPTRTQNLIYPIWQVKPLQSRRIKIPTFLFANAKAHCRRTKKEATFHTSMKLSKRVETFPNSDELIPFRKTCWKQPAKKNLHCTDLEPIPGSASTLTSGRNLCGLNAIAHTVYSIAHAMVEDTGSSNRFEHALKPIVIMKQRCQENWSLNS